MLPSAARIALACLDLTSLGDADTPAIVAALARRAHTPYGAPVAVCVHPELIFAARLSLMREGIAHVRVATAINFPEGALDEAHCVAQTRRAIAVGADEIELVFPWRAFLAGEKRAAKALVERVKAHCTKAELKVVLPGTAFANADDLHEAAMLAIKAGADFLQTATGSTGAALCMASPAIISAIRATTRPIGLKIAGGFSTLAEMHACITLASELYGRDRVVPARFRLGAETLSDELLTALAADPVDES